MLEGEGETVDVPVTMPPGHYYFQCDPHLAHGMIGHLIVQSPRGTTPMRPG
jgi:plastocyanin